ncbi:MAG TPA: hypothetical protein VFZ27_00045 [Terriglobia bacterium]|nr:hypothetical protein [Terriglobia bacterium]
MRFELTIPLGETIPYRAAVLRYVGVSTFQLETTARLTYLRAPSGIAAPYLEWESLLSHCASELARGADRNFSGQQAAADQSGEAATL